MEFINVKHRWKHLTYPGPSMSRLVELNLLCPAGRPKLMIPAALEAVVVASDSSPGAGAVVVAVAADNIAQTPVILDQILPADLRQHRREFAFGDKKMQPGLPINFLCIHAKNIDMGHKIRMCMCIVMCTTAYFQLFGHRSRVFSRDDVYQKIKGVCLLYGSRDVAALEGSSL